MITVPTHLRAADHGITVTTSIMLPVTTRERYITGIPALSVPCDGILSDWHFSTAFSGKKPLPIAGVTMDSTEHLWGVADIEDQSAYFRDTGIAPSGAVYVASAARAIADLLHHLLSRGQDPAFLCVDQIPMSDRSMMRLHHLIGSLLDVMPTPMLRTWLEKQRTLRPLVTWAVTPAPAG